MLARSTMPYERQFFAGNQPTSLRSAEIVVPMVAELIAPGSVIDLGCGTGSWLTAFAAAGVGDFVGVDAEHVPVDLLVIPTDRFHARDLRRPLRWNRRFDLALSLEVAEHLPPACAVQFVSDLTSLAPAVLFSAAIPFQSGHSHLNEQWPSYWAKLFARHAYQPVDCIRDRIWNNPEVEWWYAQNMLLFVGEEELTRNPRLREMAVGRERLSRVHPLNYLSKADPAYLSVKSTAELTLRLARRRLLRVARRTGPGVDFGQAKIRELERVTGG